MGFNSKKLFSVAAVAAILSAPIVPYASSVVEAEEAIGGFYIVSPDNSKLFYSINDLFEDYSDEVFASINQAGFDNVYFVQDGGVNNLNDFFVGAKPIPYDEGVIPAGQYVDVKGNAITVKKETAAETDEFEVLSIE